MATYDSFFDVARFDESYFESFAMSEGFFLAEALNFSLSVATSESVLFAETSTLSPVKAISDNIFITESLSKQADFVRYGTDIVAISEAFAFIFGKFLNFADITLLLESSNFVASLKNYEESIVLSEIENKILSQSQVSESAYMSETSYLSSVRIFPDDLFISESYQHGISQNTSDFALLNESLNFSLTQPTINESLYLSEILCISQLRTFSDSVTLAESYRFDIGLNTSESITIDENFHKNLSTLDDEVILLMNEYFTFFMGAKVAYENVALAEVTSKEILKYPSEDIFLSEIYSKAVQTFGVDVLNVSELATLKTLKTPYNENIYVSEVLSKSIVRTTDEDIFLSESFSKKFMDTVSEGIRVAEDFSKEHYAERIESVERPYITEIKSVPVLTGVLGFVGKGGHV